MTQPSPTSRTDAELVLMLKEGDRNALGALIERHGEQLRTACRHSLADPGLTDDAVQETILIAMTSVGGLRQPDSVGPWLIGIGKNVARRWNREAWHRQWSLSALDGGKALPEPSDPGEPPDEAAEHAVLRAAIREALASLPPGQRRAVALVDLAGVPAREAAAILGTSLGAIKTRLHKGRLRLRSDLHSLRKEWLMTAPENLVPMQLVDVRRKAGADGPLTGAYMLVFEDRQASRVLPVWVAPGEAIHIALLLRGVQPPRPTTFRLAASLLDAAGARFVEARITSLRGDTYHGAAVVSTAGGEAVVDARPSDAVALALAAGAPIRCETAVLEAAARLVSNWDQTRPDVAGISLADDDPGYIEGSEEIVAAVTANWG